MSGKYFDYEEIAEENMDTLYSEILMRLEEEDSKLAVVNPDRIKEFMEVFKNLEKYARANKAKILFKIHTPLKNMGYIGLIGKDMTFMPDFFEKVSGVATVVDVSPKTNGVVQIDFVFNDLTVVQ